MPVGKKRWFVWLAMHAPWYRKICPDFDVLLQLPKYDSVCTQRLYSKRRSCQKFNHRASKRVYNGITGDESWIYYGTGNEAAVWLCQNELLPTKIVRSLSTSKKLIACFIAKSAQVATSALENCCTVNVEWYVTICSSEGIDWSQYCYILSGQQSIICEVKESN